MLYIPIININIAELSTWISQKNPLTQIPQKPIFL